MSSTTTPGLPLQLSARIFATVALKTDAVSVFVHGNQFAIVRRTSSGAGTIIPEGDIPALLSPEFDAPAAARFLRSLSKGALHLHRYEPVVGDYQSSPEDLSSARIPRRALAANYDPVHPTLKSPRDLETADEVSLTMAGSYLESFPAIAGSVFEEAMRRLYGESRPELMDMLWMHAAFGELDGGRITESVRFSKAAPARRRDSGQPPRKTRFPYLPLEYDRQGWAIDERYVVGPQDTKERVLEVLRDVPWSVRFWKESEEQPRRRERPPTAQRTDEPQKRGPKPKRDSPRVISDMLLDPQQVWKIRRTGTILAITQPEILVESLARISADYFCRAVEWSLGVRSPREGERLAFTAGIGFSRRGRIRDCLFVCPQIPLSRSGSQFPKVWMEFRGGRWTILSAEAHGQGAQELIHAVLSLTDWGVQPAIVNPPDTDKT